MSSSVSKLFQFLYGSIEVSSASTHCPKEILFQFLYGSIEVAWTNSIHNRILLVSIPIWFDWGHACIQGDWVKGVVSIPIWFDWGHEKNTNCFIYFYVSIPIWLDWGITYIDIESDSIGFNSYMVRLRLHNLILAIL